ncbi:hypothetical protein FIV00_00050 [Labrenzia sp. THAF82]|uniref:hypothetical protein n=1 Tax=Labrenzia sp. THAF82 TaxID=2587861 RepID=UPI0012698271|nr:hypothetical protein [Labrenzia sp. THAF82]QFT28865.1 hypothetical protein FIV00_00050 [Labrenzia sp. THAF82]
MSTDTDNRSAYAPLRETVTRAEIDNLKTQISRPSHSLDYTPGGMRETSSHKMEEAQKRARIAHGEERLHGAHVRFDTAHTFAAKEGAARSQMNMASKAWSPKSEVRTKSSVTRER